MKSVIVNYAIGLGNFLDDNGWQWKGLDNDRVEIFYTKPADLFTIGMRFGIHYSESKEVV